MKYRLAVYYRWGTEIRGRSNFVEHDTEDGARRHAQIIMHDGFTEVDLPKKTCTLIPGRQIERVEITWSE